MSGRENAKLSVVRNIFPPPPPPLLLLWLGMMDLDTKQQQSQTPTATTRVDVLASALTLSVTKGRVLRRILRLSGIKLKQKIRITQSKSVCPSAKFSFCGEAHKMASSSSFDTVPLPSLRSSTLFSFINMSTTTTTTSLSTTTGPDPAVMEAIERGNAVVFMDVVLGGEENFSPLGRIKLELFTQDVRVWILLIVLYCSWGRK